MPSDHHPAHDVAPNAAAPSATALNAVANALAIDPTRTVRDTPNGFTWWIAPGLRQHVQVEAGPPSATPWLRIETPVLRGADPQAIAPLLIALHHHARGAAVLHAPDSGDVALVTRAPLPGPLCRTHASRCSRARLTRPTSSHPSSWPRSCSGSSGSVTRHQEPIEPSVRDCPPALAQPEVRCASAEARRDMNHERVRWIRSTAGTDFAVTRHCQGPSRALRPRGNGGGDTATGVGRPLSDRPVHLSTALARNRRCDGRSQSLEFLGTGVTATLEVAHSAFLTITAMTLIVVAGTRGRLRYTWHG